MDASEEGEDVRWHALEPDAVSRLLAVDAGGLDEAEAAVRLGRHGPNSLPRTKGRGALARFVAQFDNLLIYVLLVSALISLALGHMVDALVILAVVVLNAIVGFVQEGRAERALDAIGALIDPRATLMRGGRRTMVAAQDVVPGDVVLLEAGDRVPADLRLVRCRGLRI